MRTYHEQRRTYDAVQDAPAPEFASQAASGSSELPELVPARAAAGTGTVPGATWRSADAGALDRGAAGDARGQARLVAHAGAYPVRLDLFRLVWIFALCSVVGLMVETVVSYPVDHVWKDRAGLLWGPFSPIYGVGGVLMTVALRPFAEMRLGVLYGVAALVGGAFEFFAGWFWESAFGIVAWDYSSQPFNLGGHTCLGIALVWGALGAAWMRIALPRVMWLSDAVPVAWRRPIAYATCAFLLVDAAATFVAFDCWMNRLAGVPVEGPVQQFFADHYGDGFMASRFQTMSVYPVLAHR